MYLAWTGCRSLSAACGNMRAQTRGGEKSQGGPRKLKSLSGRDPSRMPIRSGELARRGVNSAAKERFPTPDNGTAGRPPMELRVSSSVAHRTLERCSMNQIIYLIGLIVVIMAVLSLLGLR